MWDRETITQEVWEEFEAAQGLGDRYDLPGGMRVVHAFSVLLEEWGSCLDCASGEGRLCERHRVEGNLYRRPLHAAAKAARKAQGLCLAEGCHQAPEGGTRHCGRHRDKLNQGLRERRAEKKAQGICIANGCELPAERIYCKAHREKIKAYQRTYRTALRATKRSQGVCIESSCSSPRAGSKARCQKHLERQAKLQLERKLSLAGEGP